MPNGWHRLRFRSSFINGDPGVVIRGQLRDRCRTWPFQTEVTVPGIHYLQEDSADLIGIALSDWVTSLKGRP